MTWKSFLALALLLAAAATRLALAEESSLPKFRTKLAAQQPAKIVCLGDSVTGIYYHTGGRRAYPEMIAVGLKRVDPKSNVAVINAGISGNTTVDALGRLEKDVLAHQPDLVTVMFGLNDVRRVSLDEFRANLKAIIERCRNVGAEVLLCSPNGIVDSLGDSRKRLQTYNDAMRQVGTDMGAAFCDVFAAYETVRAKDPLSFRLLCSDDIHPNMGGHKLTAETICQAIAGKSADLSQIGPPSPALPRTMEQLEAGQPVRVYAMSPYDQWIGAALKSLDSKAQVDVMRWETQGKTLSELHDSAKGIRQLAPKPDLVIVAIPLEVTPPLSEPEDPEIRDHSWILNFSLSFGVQEWDVIGVAPSVLHADLSEDGRSRDAFSRKMIVAQDLNLIVRPADSEESPQRIFERWFRK
jgi:lysophospholipase L1-like esterase